MDKIKEALTGTTLNTVIIIITLCLGIAFIKAIGELAETYKLISLANNPQIIMYYLNKGR